MWFSWDMKLGIHARRFSVFLADRNQAFWLLSVMNQESLAYVGSWNRTPETTRASPQASPVTPAR
ncbi:protein of unknown function [Paraburkholderia kururiensis]